MKSGLKCPECNSCLDIVWIMPRRFFHCWLCKQFYDKVDKEFVKIDIQKHINISTDDLENLMENYYNEST